MRTLLPFAALVLAAAPLPAAACSPVAGYRPPTNFELTAAADLILLAAVEDGATQPGSEDAMTLRVRPLAAIKGTMPTGPITLPQAMIATGAMAGLSNPYDLAEPHPQSLAGACNRYAFPRGSHVLFFLKQRDGQWVPAGGPFSRWAEDVLTDDAPWLQATRLYAEVAALPVAEQAPALTRLRDAYRARADDPLAQTVADDIDRQIAGPKKPLREPAPAPEGD
ncbi:hypothetical protein [Sphingopyxis sp. NJF-3]